MYHVAANGIDTNNGLTELTPWQTNTKVNAASATFVAGDRVAYRRGDAWPSAPALAPATSGSAVAEMTATTYGVGALPKIGEEVDYSGWTVAGNWTETTPGSNIWKINNTNAFPPQRMWFNGTTNAHEKFHANAAANVTAALPWFWDSSPFDLYVYAVGNPASYYTSIKSLQNGSIVNTLIITARSYWRFEYLDFRAGSASCVSITAGASAPAHHITFAYCNLGWHGRTGLYAQGHGTGSTSCDHLYILNCIIDPDRVHLGYTAQVNGDGVNDGITFDGANDCEIKDTTIRDYGHSCISGYGRALWTTSRNKVHRVLMHAENSEYCRGIGILGPEGQCRDWEIKGCIFRDLTVRNQIWGHHHTVAYCDFYRFRQSAASASGTAQGIELWATGGGSFPTVCHDITLAHLTFYDLAEPAIHFRAPDTYTVSAVRVLNCIMMKCGTASRDGYANICIAVANDAEIGHNEIRNNLGFVATVANIANIRGTLYAFAGMNALETTAAATDGFDRITANADGDPLFTNAAAGDFHLSTGSPAIGMGLAIAGVNEGHAGTLPDAGAHEYSGLFTKIAVYRDGSKVASVARTAGPGGVQRLSGAAAGMSGLSPGAVHQWKFKGETATGIESDAFSPTLTSTQAGGTIPTPSIAVGSYNTAQNGFNVTVTPGSGTPSGVTWQLEHSLDENNPYNWSDAEQSTTTTIFHNEARDELPHVDYVRVFGFKSGWANSAYSNIGTRTIPPVF